MKTPMSTTSLNILYSYPKWHTVSFTLVARKHIEYMRKVFNLQIYEVDELYFPSFTPVTRYKAIVHPAFFIMHKILKTKVDTYGRFREDYYKWWRSNYDELIGVDVCDSDQYSDIAIELANRYDKFIVPSSYCVEVAKRSGFKAKVYRVPHGVDPEWYTTPNVWESMPVKSINPLLLQIYLYKIKKNKKIILFWLWHSGERKGWPEVYEVYTRLCHERRDVAIILKTGVPNPIEYQQLIQYDAINIYGWLNDYEKMALYDLVDITLNFSRGGGFECVCLESLVRGVPCVACEHGSWTDYVPPFLWIKKGKRVRPLPNNALHVGYGYAVDVEDALNKLHHILDNLDDYKARVLEWREKKLKKEYRWDIVAKMLYNVVVEDTT